MIGVPDLTINVVNVIGQFARSWVYILVEPNINFKKVKANNLNNK